MAAPDQAERGIAGREDAARIGRAIAERRRRRGLTQQQLADKAGVSRTFLIALEAGHERAELGKVLAVIDALEVRANSRAARQLLLAG